MKTKIIKKAACAILAICLLFVAACSRERDTPHAGQNAQNLSTQGRFVETDISPPIEGRFTTFLSGNNTLISYSEGLTTRAESTDSGETWTTSPGPGANTDRFRHLDRLTKLPNGNLMAFMFNEGLVVIHPDGTSEPFSIEEIDNTIAAGDMVMISQLQTVGNDRLLLSYSTMTMDLGAMTFDETGAITFDETDEITFDETEVVESEINVRQGFGSTTSTSQLKLIDLNSSELIATIPIDGVHAITSDENHAYLLLFDNSISKLDIETGAIVDNHAISLQQPDIAGASHAGGVAVIDIGQSGRSIAPSSEGGLFSISGGNLLYADNAGNISTILEGTMYSIGAPRTSINSLFALDDGSIIAAVTTGGQSRLYKYTWDENAVVDPDKILTIWSLEDNSLVRAAITEFRRNNPTATISFEVALSGTDAMGVSDAIRTLNTRLLSGDAPDVLILDGSPLESYASRGMLFDMSNLVHTDDIFANLLEPFVSDESLYFIPTQLLVPTLIGGSDALSEVQTLDELVQAVVTGNDIPLVGDGGIFSGAQIPPDERPALNFDDLKELHDVMWSASAPAIISNNTLNSEALRKYLEALKAISDKYGLADDISDSNDTLGMAVFSSVHVAGGGGGESDPVIMTGSLMNYAMGHANLGAFTASNLMVLPMMFSRADSELNIFPGLSPGVWLPTTKVGISADSNSPELAAEFINTMLSPNVQQFNYGIGLPITQSGMATQANAVNDIAAEMDSAARVDADGFISQLRTPSMTDILLKDMLWENIERFVKGELDIEGALRTIEQSVRNYLAEREI